MDALDQQIVRRTLSGEPQAFEQIVLRYERGLYAHLFRLLGRVEDAEDLAQETFLNAFRHLRSFKVGQPFRPWLYRIATNAALSMLRRRKIVIVSAEEEEIAIVAPDDEDIEVNETRFRHLEDVLQSLAPEERALLDLHYREGMKFQEIGEVLGRSAGAVGVALHRLRRQLREQMRCLEEEERKEWAEDEMR